MEKTVQIFALGLISVHKQILISPSVTYFLTVTSLETSTSEEQYDLAHDGATLMTS